MTSTPTATSLYRVTAAGPDATVGGYRVAGLPSIDTMGADPAGHTHGLDALVGYVVRRTIVAGDIVRQPDGEVGEDVAVIDSPFHYALALEVAATMRTPGVDGDWAVVDNVYACGCRS